MVRKKATLQITVADATGGKMKLEDRRFEKGDWPISFEIPLADEQAERWSRYLKWECHKRGWSPSSIGQLDRQENSGTITVTGDGAPKLDIVWEHSRDDALKVRARVAAASRLSIDDAEQFFCDINNGCSAAVTTPLYVRGTLQYDKGLAWLGEHWLDDETRLAPPSLQDELSLHNGARIVHIDALLPCVGEPDVPYMRQQMLNEISLFLSVIMKADIRLLQVGRAWKFTVDKKGCEVRQLGYLEPANPLTIPARGAIGPVPLHTPDNPLLWGLEVGEVSLRDDISELWASFRNLDAEHRLQFLQAAAKWQEAMIHWQDRPSLSFALMAVSCEALKTSDADRRNNCYDVIEALLGKAIADGLRQNPWRAQHVRNTHLHIGEFHGSELMMANFMRTYQDPSFLEAHRTMAQVTPAAIVEWLKRGGTFSMPPVAKHWTLRRWLRNNLAIALGLVFAAGLVLGWLLRVF
jgi:hypothetical protein